MAEIPKWRDIACECGGTWLTEVYKKKWHPTGGTSRGEIEERCVECGTVLDPQAARDRYDEEQALRQLEAIQERLGQRKPTAESQAGASADPATLRSRSGR